MFDFGFWELVLVMIVGLVVIGPKRLPRVAAQVGEKVGRLRALMHQFRQNVQQELQAEELKRILHEQQNEIQELRDIVQQQDDSDASLVEAIEEQIEGRAEPNEPTTRHDPERPREND